jgi:four helix bundle protein
LVPGSGFRFRVQVQVPGSGFRFEVPGSRLWIILGMATASVIGMTTARSHEDLDAWTLAVTLRDQVFAFTARAHVQRHVSFCDQIRRSAGSAPANIAEGFRRYKPRDFARHLRIALGSLGETQNYLQHARTQQYISPEEFAELWRLSSRAIGACSRLRSYLSACPDRP